MQVGPSSVRQANRQHKQQTNQMTRDVVLV